MPFTFTNILLALFCVVFIFILGLMVKKSKSFAPIVVHTGNLLIEVLKLLKEKRENSVNETKFDALIKVAKNSVYAVEQIANTEDMSSEEKKNLAIEQFKKTALALNIEVDSLDEKTIEGFIESAVYFLNSIKS